MKQCLRLIAAILVNKTQLVEEWPREIMRWAFAASQTRTGDSIVSEKHYRVRYCVCEIQASNLDDLLPVFSDYIVLFN